MFWVKYFTRWTVDGTKYVVLKKKRKEKKRTTVILNFDGGTGMVYYPFKLLQIIFNHSSREKQ